MVEPTWVGADLDSWAIDHGTWSVLAHAFPDHSVPVVQLSINAYKPLDYHLELGARLAPLRDRGVLIVVSGNVVHNLGAMDPSLQDGGFGWAQRFDDAARAQVLDDPVAAVRLQEQPDYPSAVPTSDHFIPLLYFAGLAAADAAAPTCSPRAAPTDRCR